MRLTPVAVSRARARLVQCFFKRPSSELSPEHQEELRQRRQVDHSQQRWFWRDLDDLSTIPMVVETSNAPDASTSRVTFAASLSDPSDARRRRANCDPTPAYSPPDPSPPYAIEYDGWSAEGLGDCLYDTLKLLDEVYHLNLALLPPTALRRAIEPLYPRSPLPLQNEATVAVPLEGQCISDMLHYLWDKALNHRDRMIKEQNSLRVTEYPTMEQARDRNLNAAMKQIEDEAVFFIHLVSPKLLRCTRAQYWQMISDDIESTMPNRGQRASVSVHTGLRAYTSSTIP